MSSKTHKPNLLDNFNEDSLNPQQLEASIDSVDNPMAFARQHYENFPVASFVLPRDLRHPISLIYTFARQADDFADEGNLKAESRLAMLDGFHQQLNLIQQKAYIQSPFFRDFRDMIVKHNLPLTPFYALLSAFSQDVTKTRYANYDELADYCTRSANPIGTLLLHLFGKATDENLYYSNHICTALQLINFYQDVAIDFEKNRVYLCQDEMRRFNVTEAQIASQHANQHWWDLMRFNIERAEHMLNIGKPLGQVLPGRIGLEMRMIIEGGEHICYKLRNIQGDVFKHRPTLKAWDWPMILLKALLR